MTESHVSSDRSDLESARTVSIIVYGLYLAALINGLTAIVGVILANKIGAGLSFAAGYRYLSAGLCCGFSSLAAARNCSSVSLA